MKNIYDTNYLKNKRQKKEQEQLISACRKYVNKITNGDEKANSNAATENKKGQKSIESLNQNKTSFKSLLHDIAKEIAWPTKHGKKTKSEQQDISRIRTGDNKKNKGNRAKVQISKQPDANHEKKAVKQASRKKKHELKKKRRTKQGREEGAYAEKASTSNAAVSSRDEDDNDSDEDDNNDINNKSSNNNNDDKNNNNKDEGLNEWRNTDRSRRLQG